MKVLITGAEGQLGHDLVGILKKAHEVHPFDLDLDITDYSRFLIKMDSIKPQLVIHSAAYTNVDGCEKEPDRAFLINALGTQNVALACQKLDAAMVYISTDFVFDGEKGEPYSEYDKTNPLSVYGKSKLDGENYVRALLTRFYIVRTSWLYGKQGHNFVKTILKLADENDELTIVDDQIGSPTYTNDLAETIARLIETEWFGIYHITNSGACSWFDFAREILEKSGRDIGKVRPIRSKDLDRPAPRPAYSVLSNYMLELRGWSPLRSYQEALDAYFQTSQ